MTTARLQEILSRFDTARILLVGDFFLDYYLIADATLTETSLETGLPAYQVVAKRPAPGAAGTVAGNLRALDAKAVFALGMIGRDGEGFELRRGLDALGVNTAPLIESDKIVTPTYTKPMLSEDGVEREMSRLDIKNRRPCPSEIEVAIIDSLHRLVPQVDAVIISDQVPEHNCGVITDAVGAALNALARRNKRVVFLADSRTRIGEFRNLWIKPNKFEAAHAVDGEERTKISLEEAVTLGKELQEHTGHPLFVTLAEDGILAVDGQVHHVPTLRQTGPIDICGAGDSTMAAMALALCAGATPGEAALIGNLAASITVQQLNTTGTATRPQLLARFAEAGEQFEPRLLLG